jgi:hypothetical protein
MDDQNNSRRWDQFTIYSVAFMFLAFFFGLNFYWKIVSISVLATWLYCIFVFRKKHNGEQSDSRQTLPSRNCFTVWATWLARGFGLLLLLTWCALLSPIHIFTPTLLDAWTTYSDHPPLKSFDILYDPADAGIVEYVERMPRLYVVANCFQCFCNPWTRVKPFQCLEISR